MVTPKTTQELLATLTPTEAKVLRKRFGIPEPDSNTIPPSDPSSTPPTSNNPGNESGGTPVPAMPQK